VVGEAPGQALREEARRHHGCCCRCRCQGLT
jgi:hypothetical protein